MRFAAVAVSLRIILLLLYYNDDGAAGKKNEIVKDYAFRTSRYERSLLMCYAPPRARSFSRKTEKTCARALWRGVSRKTSSFSTKSFHVSFLSVTLNLFCCWSLLRSRVKFSFHAKNKKDNRKNRCGLRRGGAVIRAKCTADAKIRHRHFGTE